MNPNARYPSLSDKSVLISGGATGIGAELVAAFARQGARVGFIDLDEASGQALAARLGDEAGVRHRPAFAAADITDGAAFNAAIASLAGACGAFTALVNNAANDQRQGFDEITPEVWDRGIAVNLKHQFFAAQAVVPGMRVAGGGSIINLGSVSWMLKMGGMPVYTTAKSAVQGLTRSLARDLGPDRIRVNTVVPGWVMTDKQIRLWLTEAGKEDIRRGQCLQEPLLPQHIASMVLFLAADDSAMCSAQDFIVDGGWT